MSYSHAVNLEKKLRNIKLHGLENLDAQIAIEEAADLIKAATMKRYDEEYAADEHYINNPLCGWHDYEEAFKEGFKAGVYWIRTVQFTPPCCTKCNGDCGAANPEILNCPMRGK